MFFLVVLAHTDEQYNFNLLNTRELIIVINIRLSNRCREKVLDLCVGVEKKYLIYCVSFCFITGYICGRSERRVTRSSTTVSLCYLFLVLSSFQSRSETCHNNNIKIIIFNLSTKQVFDINLLLN